MTLPSRGNFYPPGSLKMPETNELPVYSMTALDEITYRTPDALFNGSAIVDVIKSCVPAIIDPWQIPVIDMPAILSNIKIASSGHNMEIDTVCPKCGEQSTYTMDLRNVVDSLGSPDYATPLRFGDVEFYFKPLTYKQINDNNKLNFEEQNLRKVMKDTEMTEDKKLEVMSTAFKKVSAYTMETIVNNIHSIKTPSVLVTEHEYILDFFKNSDKDMFNKIKDHIIAQRKVSEIKPLKIICDNDECKYEFEQPFTLDMTTFFE